jgi:hypothetical protein
VSFEYENSAKVSTEKISVIIRSVTYG